MLRIMKLLESWLYWSIIIIVLVLPVFILAAFLPFRLFMIIPLIYFIGIFWNGVTFNHRLNIVEFEIEEKAR